MAAHEANNSGTKAAAPGVAAPAAARLEVRIDDGVAVVTLARPDVHNAFDEVLIAELTATLKTLDADAAVRVVVLAGQGRSFCAGADLGWMQRMAGYSHAENLADATALATMLATLDRMAKPTIARVHGAAYGGGVGLVACCDIAVAAEEATFALSEVKLGLIPATIGPYVVAAIGARQARRYFLTAERFTAAEAMRIGLVHDVVPAAAVDRRVDALIAALRAAGPRAQAEAKALVRAVSARPADDAVIGRAANRSMCRARDGQSAQRCSTAASSGSGPQQ